jgi:hypothetical protein
MPDVGGLFGSSGVWLQVLGLLGPLGVRLFTPPSGGKFFFGALADRLFVFIVDAPSVERG